MSMPDLKAIARKILGNHLTELAIHSFRNSLVALIILAFAVGLTYIEDFCTTTHRPEWLKSGVTAISIYLLIVDGVVVCGIAGIVGWRQVVHMWKSTEVKA